MLGRRYTIYTLLAIGTLVAAVLVWQSPTRILGALHRAPDRPRRHPHSWERELVQPILRDYLEDMRVQMAGNAADDRVSSQVERGVLSRRAPGDELPAE